MKNLILWILALIGVAAIIYFGWDWIQPAAVSIFETVKGWFSKISSDSAMLALIRI